MASDRETIPHLSGSVQLNVSKLAQESLREVERLRILLTRLLSTVNAAPEESSEEDNYAGTESEKEGKRDNIHHPVSSPGGAFVEPKQPTAQTTDTRGILAGKGRSVDGPLNLHKLVLHVSDTLESIDQMANRMHQIRMSSRLSEFGLQNALGICTTVDQLDFATNEHGEPADPRTGESDYKRSDWLSNRADAERWSTRYLERTQTVLEGLQSCSMLRRSHLTSDPKRQRLNSLTGSGRDLEALMNDIHCSYAKLNITLIDSTSVSPVAHVRVGDVMQCFITFRRLHPDRIIVRGLTESMLAIPTPTTGSDLPEGNEETLSKPLEELLLSKADTTGIEKDMLFSLLAPDQRANPESRGKRSGSGAAYHNPRPVPTSSISLQLLDLVTSSRFQVFQRITTLAQCAVLHFANDYQPPSAVRGLFGWLHSYHDLFTAPCGRCGQLLGQDVNLPVWRSYPPLRKDERRVLEPQHEQCQAIV